VQYLANTLKRTFRTMNPIGLPGGDALGKAKTIIYEQRG
jgi:hypothetical protein